jgi:hypothetical protein
VVQTCGDRSSGEFRSLTAALSRVLTASNRQRSLSSTPAQKRLIAAAPR